MQHVKNMFTKESMAGIFNMQNMEGLHLEYAYYFEKIMDNYTGQSVLSVFFIWRKTKLVMETNFNKKAI